MGSTADSSAWWDGRADEWNQESDEKFSTGLRAPVLAFLHSFIGPAPLRLLDFGCGPGVSSARLAAVGHQVVGVDQSAQMVEAARRRGVEALVSNGAPLPFESASFDAAFACTSLEWGPNPAGIISELRRVIKPGGKLVAVTLGPWTPPRSFAYRRLYGESVVHNMLMPWELQRLLEEHQFAVKETHGVYPAQVTEAVLAGLGANQLLRASLAHFWAIGTVRA